MPNLPRMFLKKILLFLEMIAQMKGYKLILFRIHRDLPYYNQNNSYERVLPKATYAPWLYDAAFQAVYITIQDYTWVDEYRCFELWQQVTESRKSNGALLEVGVWRGGTGGLIAKKARMEGIKDNVYLCDTFAGVVKAGKWDTKHMGGEYADTSPEIVVELIEQKLNLSNVIVLKGVFPDETGPLVPDEQIRFCHIDVDVYQSAKDVFEWIWPRMSINSIIVFDDYGFSGASGITKFVNEERQKRDRIVLHNLNGHAIFIKIR